MRHHRDDARLIADLNDLLQLDHDAVEAYTVAIDLARNDALRSELVRIRAEHKERIEELAAMVRDLRGLPLEIPHVTAGLKIAVQTAGAVAGDRALLLAFKAVEGQVAEKFRAFIGRDHPQEYLQRIQKAAMLESKHYQWVEHELARYGIGTGTMPHNAAAALEEIHKILANPVERMTRDVKQKVGELLGSDEPRARESKPEAHYGSSTATANTAGGSGSMSNEATTANEKSDVQQFIRALHELEDTGRVDRIVQMFDTAAEISNAVHPEPRRGQDGAREFWRGYRDSFKDIHSEFQTVVEQDGKAVLEWTSRGHKPTGEEVRYSGVSVLELDQGKVRRFRAYFDPTALAERAGE